MSTEVKETQAIKEEKPKKTKKEIKPRAPKARKVEALIEEATNKMTEKEKELLIKYLRDNSTQLSNTIEQLKQNIESAYKQARELEKQYDAMEKFYREQLQYIDSQTVAFAQAVRKSTVGGIN